MVVDEIKQVMEDVVIIDLNKVLFSSLISYFSFHYGNDPSKRIPC